MKGSEILIDALIKEKVNTIFGYPGGSVIPIFDALCSEKSIKLILTRHEQGAAHAADGYARATGKPGVCIVTSGPGATNTITGIATAKLDSIPMVVISGQVVSNNIGTDAFQEIDMLGITRSICKHNYLVNDVKELPRIVKEAFHIASTGRPGPVGIDIPVNITLEELKDYTYPETVDLTGYKPVLVASVKQIKKLAKAIESAKKPLLYTGGGIITSSASELLIDFINKTKIPAVSTLMGLGSIPYDNKYYLGMPGMHGNSSANYALSECDLLIAIGVRFDDRITGPRDNFAKGIKIAHIDIDPSEIGKNVKVEIPIVGDAKNVINELLTRVSETKYIDWNNRISQLRKEYKLEYHQSDKGDILPQFAIDSINEFIDENTIVVTDVGQHQMWSAQLIHHKKPRSFLSSGGLGTMGFGLPAAMGAALGCPEKQIINISGDGGIQMNIQELTTCAINNIPVKTIVINNTYLGMVRQLQDMFWDKRYSHTCLKQNINCPKNCNGPNENCPEVYLPDFVKIAEAMGVKGFRVKNLNELSKTLDKALNTEGPVLVEILVDKLANVFPMVPSGKKNNEMLLGD